MTVSEEAAATERSEELIFSKSRGSVRINDNIHDNGTRSILVRDTETGSERRLRWDRQTKATFRIRRRQYQGRLWRCR